MNKESRKCPDGGVERKSEGIKVSGVNKVKVNKISPSEREKVTLISFSTG